MTLFLYYSVAAHALGSLQFGYHIGELNSPAAVIACHGGSIANCIPMDALQYGLIVSIFPVGGLIGSLLAGRSSDTYGRRLTSLCNCLLFIAGPLIMASAGSVLIMAIGRFCSGISSGAAMVTVPIYLSEIAPQQSRGSIGVVTQLSCVIGILIAQLAGVYLSTVERWRYILVAGAVFGALQLMMLFYTIESPKWTLQQDNFPTAKQDLSRLRGHADVTTELKSWSTPQKSRGFMLFQRPYRPATIAIVVTQLAQQFSGTNAVIFYSTTILTPLLPLYAAWISVFISLVNLVVTLVSMRLIESWGRRTLLLISLFGMSLSATVLAVSMIHSNEVFAAIGCCSMIASFGIGLGPVPFLLIAELVDVEQLANAQSFGLSLNWIATFAIGFFFPLMNARL